MTEPLRDDAESWVDAIIPTESISDVDMSMWGSRIEVARKRAEDAKNVYGEVLRLAHQAGLTWEQIGSVLGITAQGAHKRAQITARDPKRMRT